MFCVRTSRRRAAYFTTTMTVLAACGADDPTIGSAAGSGRGENGGGPGGGGPVSGGTGQVSVTGCNQATIAFEAKVPAVFILVDRSSSMFERGLWDPLKRGVLSIVKQLEQEVQFGFAAYTGEAGGTCPELSGKRTTAFSNFDAIKAAYDAVVAPSYKGETPTSSALQQAAAGLSSLPEGTPRFVVLVTDGEPDFCDDSNVVCARDAVVAAAQAAHAQGIGTLVFSVGGSVDRSHLQDVANAGSGQGVSDRQMSVFYQCNGGLGAYSGEAGSAPYYEPNVNDQTALASALSGAVASLRSCTFDLKGQVEINLSLADQGTVEIGGQRIPYGGDNGFRMNSSTQLELLGSACAQLRRPEPTTVGINFPCEAIVLF